MGGKKTQRGPVGRLCNTESTLLVSPPSLPFCVGVLVYTDYCVGTPCGKRRTAGHPFGPCFPSIGATLVYTSNIAYVCPFFFCPIVSPISSVEHVRTRSPYVVSSAQRPHEHLISPAFSWQKREPSPEKHPNRVPERRIMGPLCAGASTSGLALGRRCLGCLDVGKPRSAPAATEATGNSYYCN